MLSFGETVRLCEWFPIVSFIAMILSFVFVRPFSCAGMIHRSNYLCSQVVLHHFVTHFHYFALWYILLTVVCA